MLSEYLISGYKMKYVIELLLRHKDNVVIL